MATKTNVDEFISHWFPWSCNYFRSTLWIQRISRNSFASRCIFSQPSNARTNTALDGLAKWEFGNLSPNIFDNWFAHFIAIRCLECTEGRPKSTALAPHSSLYYYYCSRDRDRERARHCHCVKLARFCCYHYYGMFSCFYPYSHFNQSMMYYYYHRRRPRRRCVFTRCFPTSPRCARHSNPQMNYLFESFSSISDEQCTAQDANGLKHTTMTSALIPSHTHTLARS